MSYRKQRGINNNNKDRNYGVIISLLGTMMIVSSLIVVVEAGIMLPQRRTTTVVMRSTSMNNSPQTRLPWSIPRGGVTLMNEEEEEEDDDDDFEPDIVVEPFEDDDEEEEEVDDEEDEEVDDDEKEEEEEEPKTIMNAGPLTVIFQTNLGTKMGLVDTMLELQVPRTRTMEFVKKTLHKQLPGKPPVETIRLMYDGETLHDEQLMDELVDDDEDEEEDGTTMTITLDMIPPVNPKFALEMNLRDLSTEEVLQAYATNAASLYHSSQLSLKSAAIPKEEDDEEEEDEEDDDMEEELSSSSSSISIQLRHDALRIRESILEGLEDHGSSILEKPAPSIAAREENLSPQRRGQRVRAAGHTGGGSQVRRTVQRNLNVNWTESIRNVFLFLFFGFFGGRSSLSKMILLCCAPLSFLLQLRPAKYGSKFLFYSNYYPSIILSLFPAPQQKIIDFHEKNEYKILYGVQQNEVVQEEDDFFSPEGSVEEDEDDEEQSYGSEDEYDEYEED